MDFQSSREDKTYSTKTQIERLFHALNKRMGLQVILICKIYATRIQLNAKNNPRSASCIVYFLHDWENTLQRRLSNNIVTSTTKTITLAP